MKKAMNVKRFTACVGLMTGGLFGFGVNSAHAIGFQFTSECIDGSGNIGQDICKNQSPKQDMLLALVDYTNPITGQHERRSDLTLVNRAEIVSNEVWSGGNTGAASADMGDEATMGLAIENVAAAQIANADPNQQSVLTNRNLNSIVDTEDSGQFAIDLFFQQAVDNILLWERGKNSALRIQALDASGKIFGNEVKLGNKKRQSLDGFTDWYDAGFAIDTLEIIGEQNVGSIGVSKLDFGLGLEDYISGIRLISEGAEYNGPDWKVMGTIDPRYADSQDVPEPLAIAGLVVVGGAIAARHRQA